MKSEILLQEIQDIPEIETEAIWYINSFLENRKNPWDMFIPKLFTEFEIEVPQGTDIWLAWRFWAMK